MTAEKLLEQIERALRAGRVVTVADKTLRYCKRGEEFSDADQHFQALATGVFLQMPVFEGRAPDLSKPDSFTWCFYVQIDELDLVLKTQIVKLTECERDALSVDLAFSAGMASLRADQRRSLPAFDETGFDHSPSI